MMKEKTILGALATLLIGSLCFWACQKEDPLTQTPESESETGITLKSDPIDCSTHCIDPDDPVYCEKEQEKTVTWGNPRNPHSKTVEIVYFNTIEAFILKVTSSEDIANLLVDEVSVKEFSNPLPADTEYELTLPLPNDWQVCDNFSFEFSVIGNGPPAYFDVEYQLVGECTAHLCDPTIEICRL